MSDPTPPMNDPTGQPADDEQMAGGSVTHRILGGSAVRGTLSVPGDKSISHRALLLAALAEGTSTIAGLSTGEDVARTQAAIVALGARVEVDGSGLVVHGGRSILHAPTGPLDLGNSGTGMRLLAGVAATIEGTTVMGGDASLETRPMDRVAQPLALMGAQVTGHGDRCLPPVTVVGGRLSAIEYTPPMASAQVKSAILLAGLDADGETVVHEPIATRAHTEEMLQAVGADIDIERVGNGRTVKVRRSRLLCGSFHVPGDPSQAAFWLVAGVIIPGSVVTVSEVQLGAERLGFLGVLRRMGATIEVEELGNGVGSITSYSYPLHGTMVEAREIPSLDEVPILAVAAAAATGATRFRDVGELRVKESDRLASTVELVRAFGGRAEEEGDDLVIEGTGDPFRPGHVESRGDHRMAMAAAIAGAACPGLGSVSTIGGWEAVATSYPGFAEDLVRLTSEAR
jgi:3-phosphoshikimate 1-carboxyvinyltransferase